MQLLYQIALEYVEVNPKDALEAQRVTLAKYQPFVRSSIPCGRELLLRIWDDEPIALEAEDKLLEEVSDQGLKIAVYRRPSTQAWLIRAESRRGVLLAQAREDWHELRLSESLGSEALSHMLDRLIMIAYSIASFSVGMLKVHASVISQGGKALVLMGTSGTGKSTHSRLWLKHIPGARLINDDEPIVRIVDGEVRVFGCPWSGSTPCYMDESAEVVAFVHLYQAPHNSLTKESVREAFNSLYTSCSFFMPLPALQDILFGTVADVLNRVSVYRLENRPEEEAVTLSHSLLTQTPYL